MGTAKLHGKHATAKKALNRFPKWLHHFLFSPAVRRAAVVRILANAWTARLRKFQPFQGVCGGILWVSVHFFLTTKEDAVCPGHSVSPMKCLFQSCGRFCNWGVCLLPERYELMFWIQVLCRMWCCERFLSLQPFLSVSFEERKFLTKHSLLIL